MFILWALRDAVGQVKRNRGHVLDHHPALWRVAVLSTVDNIEVCAHWLWFDIFHDERTEDRSTFFHYYCQLHLHYVVVHLCVFQDKFFDSIIYLITWISENMSTGQ